jgi:hypothetical protein
VVIHQWETTEEILITIEAIAVVEGLSLINVEEEASKIIEVKEEVLISEIDRIVEMKKVMIKDSLPKTLKRDLMPSLKNKNKQHLKNLKKLDFGWKLGERTGHQKIECKKRKKAKHRNRRWVWKTMKTNLKD